MELSRLPLFWASIGAVQQPGTPHAPDEPDVIHRHKGAKPGFMGFGEEKNTTEKIQPKSIQHSFMKKIY